MSDERQPWDRLEKESTRAYAVFRAYLETPPGERSILETARRMYPSVAQKSKEKQSIPNSVAKWAKQNDWENRANLHDAAQRAKDLEATQAQREEVIVLAWDGLKQAIGHQIKALASATTDEKTRIANSLRATIAAVGLAEVVDDTPANIDIAITVSAPPDDDERPA